MYHPTVWIICPKPIASKPYPFLLQVHTVLFKFPILAQFSASPKVPVAPAGTSDWISLASIWFPRRYSVGGLVPLGPEVPAPASGSSARTVSHIWGRERGDNFFSPLFPKSSSVRGLPPPVVTVAPPARSPSSSDLRRIGSVDLHPLPLLHHAPLRFVLFPSLSVG
jgi:hypothetical protein